MRCCFLGQRIPTQPSLVKVTHTFQPFMAGEPTGCRWDYCSSKDLKNRKCCRWITGFDPTTKCMALKSRTCFLFLVGRGVWYGNGRLSETLLKSSAPSCFATLLAFFLAPAQFVDVNEFTWVEHDSCEFGFCDMYTIQRDAILISVKAFLPDFTLSCFLVQTPFEMRMVTNSWLHKDSFFIDLPEVDPTHAMTFMTRHPNVPKSWMGFGPSVVGVNPSDFWAFF